MKIPNFLPILPAARITLYTWLATVMLTAAAHAAGADSDSMATNAASPTSLASDPQLESSPVARKSKPKEEEPLIIKLMGLTIGLVAVVLGIGIGILAVWAEYKKRHDLITLCHQERMAALEKGLDLPPLPRELLTDMYHSDETSKPPSPHRGLKTGLMWLTTGIGTSIFLSLQQHAGIHPSIGLIPIGIGIVHLICYALERRRNGTRTVN
jgi:hypothetical protein